MFSSISVCNTIKNGKRVGFTIFYAIFYPNPKNERKKGTIAEPRVITNFLIDVGLIMIGDIKEKIIFLLGF